MATESTTPSQTAAPEPHHLEQQRRENRDKAAAIGLDPYGRRIDGLTSLIEAKRLYDEAADEAHKSAGKTPPPEYIDQRPVVTVAGRIVLHRDNGKLIWVNLRDFGGD